MQECTSIFMAELQELYMALQYVKGIFSKKTYVICKDSLSSLQAIRKNNYNNNNNILTGIIPEAWNIHTVIVMFQHELFVHSVATSGASLCFVYLCLHIT